MLDEYAHLVLHAGHGPDFDDAVRGILARPDPAPMLPFIARAHQRLPAAMPADATRWRMLYIDAALLSVLATTGAPRECIATLDRAIVIAGAGTDEARRDHVVHDLIRQLQSTLPWHAPSSAVCVAEPASVPHPPCTARNSVHSLAALPSIAAAQTRWSRAPFVVRGHAKDWPAMRHPHQWASLEYLFSATGPGRIVPVEVGNDYRSDNWSQELISWEAFLASLDPSAKQQQQRTTYLAQHNLLAQFPRLREDILLPDIVYASLDSPGYTPPSDVIINAWLGPKGTISPAHTDPFFNCYVQVVGRKTVWLAPPHAAPVMYPSQMSNTSRVDVFAQEVETSQTGFPLFWDAVPDEASWVTLSPGDLLFFPPGWWHAMRSEDVSFSVSMWF